MMKQKMKNKKYQLLILFSIIILLTSTILIPYGVYAEGGNNGYGYGYNGENNATQGGGYGNPQQVNQSNQNKTENQGDNQQSIYNQSGPHNQNQTGSGNQPKQWRHRYRYQNQTCSMNMDCKGNQTQIRSQYRQNNTEETFEILFNIDDIPTLKLSFIPNLNTSTNQPHFSLSIEKIIEYYDTNNNGRYDRNDLIASALSLSNMTFANISYTNTTSPDDDMIYNIETHTLNDLFALSIYLVTNKTSINNNIITPEEIKIDFIITNYSFSNQTTQLALKTRLETHNKYNLEYKTSDEQRNTATNETGMNITSENHKGFFSWSNQVKVDNKNYPVNVTILSETGISSPSDSKDEESFSQTEIIFSYPQGTSIIHDPKIGVNILGSIIPSFLPTGELTISELFNLITIYVVCCTLAAIIFIGIIYIRKKR